MFVFFRPGSYLVTYLLLVSITGTILRVFKAPLVCKSVVMYLFQINKPSPSRTMLTFEKISLGTFTIKKVLNAFDREEDMKLIFIETFIII